LKDKHFRVPEPTAKDFEVLCALLGIPERQAGELALRDWTRKNRSQVSLETWTEARSSAAPVNLGLIKIQVTIIKADLRQILDDLTSFGPLYRIEPLKKLQKMLPTAQALVEETGDRELQGILQEITAKVTQ
jgi:hypothetical protein